MRIVTYCLLLFLALPALAQLEPAIEHFKKAIPRLLPLLKRRERIPFVPFL